MSTEDYIFPRRTDSQRGTDVTSLPDGTLLGSDVDITIEKPSRADRWKRSIAARLRRQISKFVRAAHSQKEDQEAQERLRAKHLLEKQKKQKRKKVVDTETQVA